MRAENINPGERSERNDEDLEKLLKDPDVDFVMELDLCETRACILYPIEY